MTKTKLSPRQKMINMMYIVLTALLALNVSKQVLKSFHLMEQGFISNASQLDDKNSTIMKAFELATKTDAQKTRPYLERAMKARAISAEFCSYIDTMKIDVETLGGGRKDKAKGDLVGEITKADAMEKHANYFINKKKGVELQEKINSTREALLKLLKPAEDVHVEPFHFTHLSNTSQLRAEDPLLFDQESDKKTWVKMYLEENPMAGVLAMLTKIKNDAKNLETDVLTKLYDHIYVKDIPVDRIEAKVIPKSNYVMSGTPYEAEIILVASNSTSENTIKVDGKDIDVEDGKGKFKEMHNVIGTKRFEGNILVKGKDGEEKPYPFAAEYQVYKPLATISAEKMNVLYAGLDNPIAISVPGFPASAIQASISNGWRLTKQSDGKYKAKGMANTREAKVTVSVVTESGTKVMGVQEYRIKRVPSPKFKVGNINAGRPVSKTRLTNITNVSATLGESFVFNGINYRVLSYKAITVSRRNGTRPFSINGNSLSNLRGPIRSLRTGDMVIFTNIKVSGPNGISQLPEGAVFTIR